MTNSTNDGPGPRKVFTLHTNKASEKSPDTVLNIIKNLNELKSTVGIRSLIVVATTNSDDDDTPSTGLYYDYICEKLDASVIYMITDRVKNEIVDQIFDPED